jgi:hypothetical protein
VRRFLGDSIARWDGETLVIEPVRLPAQDRMRFFPRTFEFDCHADRPLRA